MREAKKDSLFKRLFGSKKSSCCEVTIEEIKEDADKEKEHSNTPSACCNTETKT